jgi:hypothetical protein
VKYAAWMLFLAPLAGCSHTRVEVAATYHHQDGEFSVKIVETGHK